MIIFIGVKIETTKNDNDLDLGKHKKICVFLLTDKAETTKPFIYRTLFLSLLLSLHFFLHWRGGMRGALKKWSLKVFN